MTDVPTAGAPGQTAPGSAGAAVTPGGMWVFAYGSLMWRPDFPHVEARRALLHGYHRALSVYSIHYRGTAENPGLVLGLERGGSCRGLAFRVAAANVDTVTATLNEREMISNVYVPRFLPVRLEDGRRVSAYVFVARRNHRQHAGRLSPERAAELVAGGRGAEGSGIQYLHNTLAHLERMGIRDRTLRRILALAEEKNRR